jgi:predicted ribosome-associated RNA-binding protein Tma20
VPKECQKRRGRKRIQDDVYFRKAKKRIQKIKDRLKTAQRDGLSVKQRQTLRNQVSAQNSRLKKKEESIYLNMTVREKDRKMACLLNGLSSILTEEQKAKIFPIAREWVTEDVIAREAPDFVDFGTTQDITQ